MKMFVTRLGFNSKAVITGDITQIDLPNASKSGLVEATKVLNNVEGISFQTFDEGDVVRHHLVQRIIRAYDEFKITREQQMSLSLGELAAEQRPILNGTRAIKKSEPVLSPDVTPTQVSQESRAQD
jgi:phosphate starvation-inducible PhoH-like protein